MFSEKWKQWPKQIALAALVLLCCSLARAEGEKEADEKPVRLWIGLKMQNPDDTLVNETLKAQLNLEDGVLINEVLPDSPAEKAGIKKHDILIQYGEIKLKTPQELIASVAKGKAGQEVSVQLIRGGKSMTLKVTPVKWPLPEASPTTENAHLFLYSPYQQSPHMQTLRVYPPTAGAAGILKQSKFPKNTSITISREGDKPAVIVAKRGDKTWQVTRDKLAELPEDIRRVAVQMLSQQAQLYSVPYGAPAGLHGPNVPPRVLPGPHFIPAQPGSPYTAPRIMIHPTQPLTPQAQLQLDKAIEQRQKAFERGRKFLEQHHQKALKELHLKVSPQGTLDEIKQQLLQLSKDVAELKKQSSSSVKKETDSGSR